MNKQLSLPLHTCSAACFDSSPSSCPRQLDLDAMVRRMSQAIDRPAALCVWCTPSLRRAIQVRHLLSGRCPARGCGAASNIDALLLRLADSGPQGAWSCTEGHSGWIWPADCCTGQHEVDP